MQAKQILFHLFMRNITECHLMYYSENQFLTDIMHGLKQIENSYKLHMQIIENLCKKQTKTRHFQMIPNSKKINMRGYGNFKKHQHPINPDGYAIYPT